MMFKTLILFSAFLLNLFLAFVVLKNGPKRHLNLSLFTIIIGVAIWNFATFMFWQTNYPLFWARLMFLGPILIPSSFLYFSFLFSEKEKPFGIWHILAIFSPWLLFLPMIPTDIIVKSVNSFDREVAYGIGNSIFAIYFVSFVIVGFFILYKKYKISTPLIKAKLSYMFFGMVISTLIGIITNLILPLLGTSKLNFIGPSATVIFVSFTTYAITRYRLMNIEMLIRKSVLYSVSTVLFTVIFFSIMFITSNISLPFINLNSFWGTLPFLIIASIAYYPLMNFSISFIDKTFFKTKLLAEKIAVKFSHKIKKLRTIEEFSKFITNTSSITLKLNGVATFIIDEECSAYICTSAKGSLTKLKGTFISQENSTIKELIKTKSSIVKEEIDIFDKDITLLVPCFGGEEQKLLGFLASDCKKDMTPFSDEEIQLFETLANQTAAGIDNAIRYKQKIKSLEKSLKLEKLASLGVVIAGIAHEVKNALTFVSIFSQLLPHQIDNKEFLDNYSVLLQNEIRRIKLILQGIQDYSKQSTPVIEKINPKELSEETIILVRDLAKGKNIIITNQTSEDHIVLADKNRMKQVLLNLFINAIDAMPNGGILSLHSEKKDEEVIIKISDTGKGISKEMLGKIFDPFFTTKEHGTGLGLAIAFRFANEHNAAISVESEIEKGTTFSLVFKNNAQN